MEQHFAFRVSLRDHAGQLVDVELSGTVQRVGQAIDPQRDERLVHSTLWWAASLVLSRAQKSNELALPTLASSLPHHCPAITSEANRRLATAGGIELRGLTLQAQVPPSASAPAAAAVAAAPSPLASGASHFASHVAASMASSTPNGVRVGGFRVGGDESLGDQAAEKVKGQLLHYAILAGVALFVGLVCVVFIAYKALFG